MKESTIPSASIVGLSCRAFARPVAAGAEMPSPFVLSGATIRPRHSTLRQPGINNSHLIAPPNYSCANNHDSDSISSILLGFQMKRFLLASTAIAALVMHLHVARAAELDGVGNVDYPTTFISFEGGYIFDASPSNASFPEASESEPCDAADTPEKLILCSVEILQNDQLDEDDKLGGLGSLNPGQNGFQGRFELGQRLNDHWDYKVGLGAIYLNEDTSTHEETDTFINIPVSRTTEGSQNTNLRVLDIEVGYRPDEFGGLQTRLFAGVRGLNSTTEMNWKTSEALDKMGEFQDSTYAIGPRIGVDVMVPLNLPDVALVGSASGSALFGYTESEYHDAGLIPSIQELAEQEETDWNSSEVIWNVEGMAGVSFGIGDKADLTLGYRAAQYSGLMIERSDINKVGDFSDDGRSDLLVHGPFARLTVEIP